MEKRIKDKNQSSNATAKQSSKIKQYNKVQRKRQSTQIKHGNLKTKTYQAGTRLTDRGRQKADHRKN